MGAGAGLAGAGLAGPSSGGVEGLCGGAGLGASCGVAGASVVPGEWVAGSSSNCPEGMAGGVVGQGDEVGTCCWLL